MARYTRETIAKCNLNRPLKKLFLTSGFAFLSAILLMGCATVHTDPDFGALRTKNCVENGQYREAIEIGKQSTLQNPTYAPTWYWLGIAYIRNKQYDESISALNKAVACKPNSGQLRSSYHHLGFACENAGDLQEAIRWYGKALKLQPTPTTFLQRSYCYLYEGRYDKALADVDRAMRALDPREHKERIVEAFRTRAFSYLGLGETEKALFMLQKAKEISPAYSPSDDLVLIYYATGNRQELKELMGNQGWLGAYVREYRTESVKAIQVYAVVKNSAAERGNLMEGDVIVKIDNSACQDVNEFINKIANTAPGSPVRIEILRGKEQRELNITLGSRIDKPALALLKSDIRIASFLQKKEVYEQAEEAENSGDYRKALHLYLGSSANRRLDSAVIKRIIKLCPKIDPPPAIPEEARKRAVFAMTAVKQARGEKGLDGAIAEYEEAIRLAPWWAGLHLNLALVHEQRGNYRQAAESLSLFLLASPNDPEAAMVQNKIYELEYKAKRAQRE